MQPLLIPALKRKGFKIYEEVSQLNIIGIRKAVGPCNSFNDKIVVFFRSSGAEWICYSFTATTYPGSYWLQKPINPGGTAILLPGQYIGSHQLGLHRGKYRALIQKSPLPICRDNDRDIFPELNKSTIQTGMFGINIHRAMAQADAATIDKFSAGCQVFQDPKEFSFFITLADAHRKLYGNSFTYTLINDTDL